MDAPFRWTKGATTSSNVLDRPGPHDGGDSQRGEGLVSEFALEPPPLYALFFAATENENVSSRFVGGLTTLSDTWPKVVYEGASRASPFVRSMYSSSFSRAHVQAVTTPPRHG
jgi:hypothetical protein